ncbi:MAG: S24 family peptidase [Thermodesulfovibrionales bacterium]|nr:S24 family peptidase [Thermodesulfovibrionales bacterium]
MIYVNFTKDPDAFALRVEGDSMIPEYQDGDIIIVSPNTQVFSGNDAVVMYNNEVTLKRIKWDNEHVSIIPLNEKYPILVLRGEQARQLKIIGKVTEIYKKGGEIWLIGHALFVRKK